MRLRLGDPLPEDKVILPLPEGVREVCCTVAPGSDPPHTPTDVDDTLGVATPDEEALAERLLREQVEEPPDESESLVRAILEAFRGSRELAPHEMVPDDDAIDLTGDPPADGDPAMNGSRPS
jgi:hypothetical protein